MGDRKEIHGPFSAPELWAVVLISLGGAALRFHGLGRLSIWLDEAWLVAWSKLPWEDLLGGRTYCAELPFIFWLKFVGIVAGYTETSVRLISAVAGTLLIPFSYLLAKRFVSVAGALLASAMIAFAPIAIVYSQEAATYSLWMLMVVLYVSLILNYIETPRRSVLAQFFIVALISTYLHAYNVFIVAATAAYLAVSDGRDLRYREFYLSLPLLALLSAPPLWSVWRIGRALSAFRTRAGALTGRSFEKVWQCAKVFILSWFHGPTDSIYTPKSPYGFMQQHSGGITAVIFFLFVVAVLSSLVDRKSRAALLAFIVSGHLGMALYFGAETGHVMERYGLPLLPLFFILFVRLFFHKEASFPLKIVGALSIGIVLVNFATIQAFNPKKVTWKEDWRTICRILREDIGKSPGRRFAILVPYNVEGTLTGFYLPDFKASFLTDSPYHSYLYDLDFVWVSSADAKGYNLALLDKAKRSSVETIYIPVYTGRAYMEYIAPALADEFYIERSTGVGVSAGIPSLYIYRRRGGLSSRAASPAARTVFPRRLGSLNRRAPFGELGFFQARI